MCKWKKYILWFAQEHINFRAPEIDSISKLFGFKVQFLTDINNEIPFWIVKLPDENAAKSLASRSVTLRCILELWGHGETISQLHEDVQSYITRKASDINSYFSPQNSFKFTVDTYNRHFTQKEKIEKIEAFSYLPLQGNVNLKTPDVEWWYIEFYGLNPMDVPEEPSDSLLGRWIANGQRNLIKELSLKTRKFIANTSMDAQLSVIMANQAMVKPGDIVYDPFVGSGSLLVSAAKFGGMVLGSDIDYMIIHAKCRPSRIQQKVREKDESIKANLEQYECGKHYLDVVVSDFSNTIWRDEIQFDSIITDPPYGIREATEKIESKIKLKPDTRSEDSIHYPSTSPYSLNNLYEDLLFFATKHLRIGGRLVTWLPVHKKDYTSDMIPKYKNLILLANSEQVLSALNSRRLLTYEKTGDFNEENTNDTSNNKNPPLFNFREKYFSYGEDTRQERRTRQAELREIGRQEALKRGKSVINGKVVNQKSKG